MCEKGRDLKNWDIRSTEPTSRYSEKSQQELEELV